MAVCRRLLVDRPAQIQHPDDPCRAQIKVLPDDLHQSLIAQPSGSKGFHPDGCGMGHADGVGELNLALAGQACGHNILGHVPGRVGCGAVHLGAVLSGKRAAAVPGIAAVAVHDNFPARKAAVPVGTADHKTAGGIDKEFGLVIHHIRRKDLVKDMLLDIPVNLLLGHALVVLGGEDHCVQAHRLVILIILHRDLGLSVRPQVGKRAVLADLSQASCQLVGQGDGIGHILLRLVGGVAEHHALISRADGVQLLLGHMLLPCLLGLQSLVNAQGNICGLLIDGGDHAAGIAVKAILCPVIADLPDGLPDNLLDVYIGAGGNLSHNQHQSCGDGRLAGHPAHGILLHQGIEDRVGNGIADLIRMSLCHGL